MSDTPSNLDLANIKAMTFDCYGTIIDWERGISNALRPWAKRTGASASDDELLVRFAEVEPAVEQANPSWAYTQILRCVHRRLAQSYGAPATDIEADRFARSVGDWPVFADSLEALGRLKRCCKLIVVSNVDRESFAQTNKQLGAPFDAIVTAQDVGAYKPDRRMFDAAINKVESLNVARMDHVHVAQSLYHDIAPAAAMGIATCWVDRQHGAPGGATSAPTTSVTPDLTVQSLAQLADAVEASHGRI